MPPCAGLPVVVEVALGAELGPGHPAGLHLGGGVEVVPGAADPVLPPHRAGGGGVEVVSLAADGVPAGPGAAVRVEVALGAELGPGHPAGLHDA